MIETAVTSLVSDPIAKPEREFDVPQPRTYAIFPFSTIATSSAGDRSQTVPTNVAAAASMRLATAEASANAIIGG